MLSALLLAGVAAGGAVASFEGLTATATNPGASPYNQFTTGSVTIADNEASTAMFSVSNADPPATGSACIAVQYTGTVTNGSDVYLYAPTVNDTSTNSLGQYITLGVQDGIDSNSFGTADPTCAHFTANTDTTVASHSVTGNAVAPTALSAWAGSDATGYAMSATGSAAPVQTWTTDPTTVWYKFTYAIASNAPSGSSANIQLTWEADGQ